MSFREAVYIFNNINSEDYSPLKKAAAVYKVMNMETHNSITKKSMLEVIKWLWESIERDVEI